MILPGILSSQISGHLSTTAYESIATVTVGSTTSSINFSSIPSTYTHLQLRGIIRSDYAANSTSVIYPYLNNDTTSSNYYSHRLLGENSSVYAQSEGTVGGAYMAVGQMPLNNNSANIFGAFVLDILDYANVNKYKTLRGFGGVSTNGGGSSDISLGSGLWKSTSAINQITFLMGAGSFLPYSSIALYGVK